ncbi:hypothetical protein BX070DRAFT_225048 [Coemansia spiralis]|nr:hypothetical protein BX070DRAFT_225048 [Coemansia spiralis]
MTNTHAYFLIDFSALDNYQPLVRIITRILVFLASKNEALTWNYEIIDLGVRQRAMRVQAKRRVAERKQLSMDTIEELEATLSKHQSKREKQGKAQGKIASSGTRRAVLDTLNERLMCLEADVEWGDPALMRSPTRHAAGARTWTDPTRLNESISVRSHLYVVGHAPGTLDELDSFVYGASAQQNQSAALLDKLLMVRNGVVGNGIWESYARKRVGVSWIRPSDRKPIAHMDPVDILIEGVFDCCYEALGGCVMTIPELDANTVLPFSSVFSQLHRVRTYPSWSRKFAREISAVVDYLASAFSCCHSNLAGGSTENNASEKQAWVVTFSTNQMESSTVTGANRFYLIQAKPTNRQWLNNGRLLRRYNMPEMVALASDLKNTQLQKQGLLKENAVEAACTELYSIVYWPLIVCFLNQEPVCCSVQSEYRDFVLSKIVLAQVRSEIDNSSEDIYMAIIPTASCIAALYFMDSATYLSVKDYVSAADIEDRNEASQSESIDDLLDNFKGSHLEDWMWSNNRGELSIVPSDISAVNVQFDNAECDCASISAEFDPEAQLSLPVMPGGISRDANAETRIISLDKDPTECSSGPREPMISLISSDTLTLEMWYSELYLKVISEANPSFNRSIEALAYLFDSISTQGNSKIDIIQLSKVLLSSATIEDTFELDAQTQIPELNHSNSCSFKSMREQAIADIQKDVGAVAKRIWQLHECQLQILLHLFCLDRFCADSQEESGVDKEKLTESLRDLVDLLCIWASVNDLGGSSSSNAQPSSSNVFDSENCSNDLAATFIGGPNVSRFATSLSNIVEELRIQCGWVPPSTRNVEVSENVAEAKRRKGTPRKITRSSTQDRSEVIVHQRKSLSQVASGRKLARHLDELICSNKSQHQKGVTLDNSKPSYTTNKQSPSNKQKQQQPQPQLRLPLHLIRQIKSEVVMTMRSTSSKKSRAISSGTSRNSTISTKNVINSGSEKALCTSTFVQQRDLGKRAPLPDFPALNSSPSPNSHIKCACPAPETPKTKRQRVDAYAPANSSPAMLFSSPSLSAASHYIYGSEEDGDDLFEQSPLARSSLIYNKHTQQQQQSGEIGGDESAYGRNQSGSRRTLEF